MKGMVDNPVARAQGSLEYLLLIGGAVLVAIIVLLLALTLSPFGEQVFNTNLIEYEHIDLCTGEGAACSFTLDWPAGLATPPPGVILQNDSDWRTLAVTGVELSLICGDHICISGAEVTENPYFLFTLPIVPNSCAEASPGSPYHTCTPCASGSCLSSGVALFCPGGSGTECVNPFTFPASPSGVSAMITLPPKPAAGWQQKVIISGSRFRDTAVTKIRINFIVKRKDAANQLRDDSVDAAAALAFFHSPLEEISMFSCDLSGAPAPLSGCAHGPNCLVLPCNPASPQVGGSCTGQVPPYPPICTRANGSTQLVNVPAACVGGVLPPSTFSVGPTRGVTYRLKFPYLSNVSDSFVSAASSGFSIGVSDPTISTCTNASQCDTRCQALKPRVNNIVLYDLSSAPTGAAPECSALSTASNVIPLEQSDGSFGGSVRMFGGCLGSTCQPYCFAEFPISKRMNQWAHTNTQAVIGMKTGIGAVPVDIFSPYADLFHPRMDGAYYVSP